MIPTTSNFHVMPAVSSFVSTVANGGLSLLQKTVAIAAKCLSMVGQTAAAGLAIGGHFCVTHPVIAGGVLLALGLALGIGLVVHLYRSHHPHRGDSHFVNDGSADDRVRKPQVPGICDRLTRCFHFCDREKSKATGGVGFEERHSESSEILRETPSRRTQLPAELVETAAIAHSEDSSQVASGDGNGAAEIAVASEEGMPPVRGPTPNPQNA